MFSAENLGSSEFRRKFGTQYSYYSGAMYKGIASASIVKSMAQAGFLGMLGTGGMKHEEVEQNLQDICSSLQNGQSFGANILNNIAQPQAEEKLVELYLKYNVEIVEASAYMSLSKALVLYKIAGLSQDSNGNILSKNKIIAKVSRPDVASVFLSPASEQILNKLLSENKISAESAQLASRIAVADAVCVESDSGGHTDMGSLLAIFPSIAAMRTRLVKQHGIEKPLVGAAGGIGTPQSIASAFALGADFVCTGSINQCTVEAGTSDEVKTMLQGIDIQDTDYAPSGDMFELGAKVQVLKKGVFFPARANKLYELYQRYTSIDELDAKLVSQLENKYFDKSIEDIYRDSFEYYSKAAPGALAMVEKSPKAKMAFIFRWYFVRTSRLALTGDSKHKADFQVHCGPSLGAFNQIVKGTSMEFWQQRKVASIAKFLMEEAAVYLNKLTSQSTK